MIHHLAFEVDKKKIAEELSFWACFGYHPTGLRRRSRKQPPIHWLVCGDEGHAVELLPADEPRLWGLGHVCLSLDQRRWEIAIRELARYFPDTVEPGIPRFNVQCNFAFSPTGHVVEFMQSMTCSIKAGPALQP